ncbi:MAG: asparagine synthase (glutamine-hydrolyzing) [bacterium]|nr:asparagine synthase (glutamine-hydrolyzing) [bacterium]
MCGIAGIYHLTQQPIPAHCLKAMCDTMEHRGPDDEGAVFFQVRNEPFKAEGYWVEKSAERRSARNQQEWEQILHGDHQFNLALGHRRLSIIDLTSAGHQPMSNRANGIWVTFNGEIYNFRELRAQLEAEGHRFFSQSDTEVIIHLYEQYGDRAVSMLNGIFAFALWDGRSNRLILARDRYGAKPLYYTIQRNMLVFASEVKALLQVDGIHARLNPQALSDYFTFQNTYGETTLFENIHLLQPGTILIFKNDSISRHQYWDFDFEEGEDKGEAQYVDELRAILEQTVRRQLVADVPIGSYLSGGLDSGTLTALASREIPRLMTFTGGFDVATATSIENFFDERAKAELVSREFGTEHYQMVIHAGDLEWALPRVIWHAEDLRVGMSYPHYYLSQLAGKFVKVVLAGPGGDELFAGYPWRYNLLTQVDSPAAFDAAAYTYWSRLVQDRQKPSFFSHDFMRELGDYSPRQSFDRVLSGKAHDSLLKRALYVDAKTFLHGILVIEDKLSMAHSLESRVPFLDNALVDFAMKLPSKYLINTEWSEAVKSDANLSGKYLLRQAMKGILPNDIIENRKQGFSAPDQSWYMKQLVDYIRSTILSPQALDRGYFQKDYLEKVIDDHVSGRVNHRLLIWSLLSFEHWNRLFLDGEAVDPKRSLTITRHQPVKSHQALEPVLRYR